jgi:uncharacterized caspase-like protein
MLRAVVVGIDRYKSQSIPPLQCAAADARAFAGLLERRIKQDERDVHLLINEKATRENIDNLIGDYLPRHVERDDIVLLYFACHGSPERRGARDLTSLYLIPHDTNYGNIFSSAIDMDDRLNKWLKRLEDASLLVVFLDVCFSGAAGGRSFTGPILREHPTVPGYLNEPEPISIKDLRLGRGTVIITASGDKQIAKEDPETLGHGLFTYYLLKALQRPGEGTREIDLLDVYQEVDEGVRRATDDAQHPVLHMRSGVRPKLPNLG